MASQRVNKENEPSICLTAVKSDAEQPSFENAHASSHGINSDLEERCSGDCLTTSDGYPVVESDNNKNIATDQPSSPCDEETKIITSNPDFTTFNNVSTDVKLEYYERSYYRRKGSPFAIEPLKSYYRRKGFIRPFNSFKTYRRRRSGYMSLGISPSLIQNSMENKVEISAVNSTLEQSMELDLIEKPDIIVDKTCDVLSDGNNFSKSTNYIKNDAFSGITQYTELVERKQVDVEEAPLVPSETMKQQIISQPVTAGRKLLPEQSPSGSIKRKLLVLDINGLLADIVPVARISQECKPGPDTIIAGKAVFKRPFCDEFLEFCFERFSVGVWSSRTKKNVDSVLNFIMGEKRQNLLFCWDQSHCTWTPYYTPENDDKPLLLKKLNKLWEKSETDLPWKRGDYSDSDTLLLDDSPYKALLNPPNTAIFPQTYQYSNEKDSSLGPDGDLRIYLEGLSMAPNVQEYVKYNPYGQNPITEKHASWSFYHEVIESTAVGSPRKPYQSSVSSEKSRKNVSQFNSTTVVAETSKEFLGSNGTVQQHEKSISTSSPCSTQRGCKRGRSQSPRHDISNSQSGSLSPKKCRRSKSPAPSHGSDFGGDKATNYQILCPDCRSFPQGRFIRGTTCHFEHHQARHQSCADRGVHEPEGQIFKPQFVPRECYNFIQGKCNRGSSCRFSHSVTDTTGLGMEANETRGKQCEEIKRDKAVPRECYDFIQGKCSWGASCRFQHSLPGKSDLGTEGKETHDKQCDNIRNDVAVPRVCRDFIQGKCNWGASCRFLHSVPGKNDIGPEGHETHVKQCYNSRKENAVQRECNDFIRGKCNYGTSCRYLHSVPEKTDTSFHNRYYQDITSSSKISNDCGNDQRSSFNEHGRDKAVAEVCRKYTQGRCYRESHCRYLHQELGLPVRSTSIQPGDTSRFKAVHEVCRKYNWGRCNNGLNCRYLHQDSNLSGSEFTSQVVDLSIYKALPELCRNYSLGRCHKGLDCRFRHPEPFTSVGSGSTSQLGKTSRFNTVSEVCRNYSQGRCYKGLDCQYQHRESSLTFGSVSTGQYGTSRFIALPEVCRNYTHGRCHKGTDCRYRHLEQGASTSTWQNRDLPHQTTSSSMRWNTNTLPRQCVEYTQGKCWRGVHCRYPHHEPENAKDIKHLDSDVHVSVENLGDSDRRILDANNSCHEISVHEDIESETKELNSDYTVIEEKRGTMEALHDHPVDSNSFPKAFVVPDYDTKNEKVLQNVVCASSMDNLGDSDRIIQEANNQPEQMSDL